MSIEVTRYSIFYAVTGVVALFVTLVAWRRRYLRGARSIAAMLAAVAWWGLVGAVELAAVGVDAKVFWSKVCYMGTLASPVALLLFAFELRQMGSWLRPARIAALYVVPFVTLILAATNEWHGLVWNHMKEGPSGSNLVVYGHGSAFWIGAVGYSYVCVAIASLLLMEVAIQLSHLHRWRVATLLAGIALPWAGNLIYVAGLSPIPVDLAPFAMAVSGAIFYWVLVGSRLQDLVPLARLRLIERLPDAVFVLDAVGRVADLNPAAHRLLGIEGRLPHDGELRRLLPADAAWRVLTVPATDRVAFTLTPPDDRSFEAEWIELPEAGRLLIVRDTTARKRAEAARLELERRAVRAEKNESLGHFAGGVAHDFNNLLTVVLGQLSLADAELDAKSPVRKHVREAEAAGQRVAELTRRILLYAGVAHGVHGPVEIGALGEAAVREARRRAPAGVSIAFVVPHDLPLVEGDKEQIEILCSNLLTNAIEAMSGREGAITLRVWHQTVADSGDPAMAWEQEAPQGPGVALEVADTGHGMDDATRARMFEPFFSTRFMGRGLGLASVWGIVRSHGGWIGVASAPERGTRVRVAFPLPSARPNAPSRLRRA